MLMLQARPAAAEITEQEERIMERNDSQVQANEDPVLVETIEDYIEEA